VPHLRTVRLERLDMRQIGRIIDKKAEMDTELVRQMLKDADCADFLAFIRRKRNAVAKEQERACRPRRRQARRLHGVSRWRR